MSDTPKLPIKVVPPLERDFYRPEVSGGPPKVFGEVTKELRQKLASEVIAIREQFDAAFKAYPGVPAVARAKRKPASTARKFLRSTLGSTRTGPPKRSLLRVREQKGRPC